MNEIISELLHRVKRSGNDKATFSIKDIRRSYKELEIKFNLKSFIEEISSIKFYSISHDELNKCLTIFLNREEFLKSLI